MEPKDYYNKKSIMSDVSEAEIFAAELLNKIDELYAIEKITRCREKRSYRMGHDGIPDSTAKKLNEKLIAAYMFEKSYAHIGTVLDYEVPLKNSNENKGVGDVDLLSRNDDSVYILELKGTDSGVTLLSCVLEAFTYWKILDHQKLLFDFGVPQNVTIKKAVLLFAGTKAYKEYHKRTSPKTIALMKKLGVEFFGIKEITPTFEEISPKNDLAWESLFDAEGKSRIGGFEISDKVFE